MAKGDSDSTDAGNAGDMVAICDVDHNSLNKAGEKRFPKAKRYTDFRKMLDEMGKSIDAVTVSTADHSHAPASLMAMRMGKHCFCQKPLTRTIYEARLMAEVAREKNLATQMGNQGTADNGLRQAAAWLRAGVLGTSRKSTSGPTGPSGRRAIDRPATGNSPRNAGLGSVAGTRSGASLLAGLPSVRVARLVGFRHRALGDMGCHEINMVFRGLDLRDPIAITAETSGHNKDSYPAWSIVTYEFAANQHRPGAENGLVRRRQEAPAEMLEGIDTQRSDAQKKRKRAAAQTDGLPGEGKLIVGEKGRLWGYSRLLDGAEPIDVEYPKSPGHFEEWVGAIRGGEPAMSNFPDYAVPLAELVLLGNLAVWCGERIEWDAEKMQVKNVAGLEPLIKPTYRSGYTLDA